MTERERANMLLFLFVFIHNDKNGRKVNKPKGVDDQFLVFGTEKHENFAIELWQLKKCMCVQATKTDFSSNQYNRQEIRISKVTFVRIENYGAHNSCLN